MGDGRGGTASGHVGAKRITDERRAFAVVQSVSDFSYPMQRAESDGPVRGHLDIKGDPLPPQQPVEPTAQVNDCKEEENGGLFSKKLQNLEELREASEAVFLR